MKKIKLVFFLILSILLFAACNDGLVQKYKNDDEICEVKVSVCFDDNSFRSAIPFEFDSSVFADFNYIAISGSQNGKTQQLGTWDSYSSLDKSRITCESGSWDFNIVLLTPYAKFVGSTANKIINNGTDNELKFFISLDEYKYLNTGLVNLEFEYPASTRVKYAEIEYVDYLKNSVVKKSSFTATKNDDKFTLTINDNIPAGSYKMITHFYADKSHTQETGNYPQLVTVLEDKTTSKKITLSENSFVKVYSVTYEDSYFDDSYEPTVTYIKGQKLELPDSAVVKRDDYFFLGWFETKNYQPVNTNDSKKCVEISTSSTGDKTFYAKWAYNDEPKPVSNLRLNETDKYAELKVSFDLPQIVSGSLDDDIKFLTVTCSSPQKTYEKKIYWSNIENKQVTREQQITYVDDYTYRKNGSIESAEVIFKNVEPNNTYKCSVVITDKTNKSKNTDSENDLLVCDWVKSKKDFWADATNSGDFYIAGTRMTDFGKFVEVISVSDRYKTDFTSDYSYFTYKNDYISEDGISTSNISSFCNELSTKLSQQHGSTIRVRENVPTGYPGDLNHANSYTIPEAYFGVFPKEKENLKLKPYAMGTHEVPNALYAAVMGIEYEDGLKAAYMNWYQAIAFCNKYSIRVGLEPCYSVQGITDWEKLKYEDIPVTENVNWTKAECDFSKNGFRMPTEQEWEYTARVGNWNKTMYSVTYNWKTDTGDNIRVVGVSVYHNSTEVTTDAYTFASDGLITETPTNIKTGFSADALDGRIKNMVGNALEWCFASVLTADDSWDNCKYSYSGNNKPVRGNAATYTTTKNCTQHYGLRLARSVLSDSNKGYSYE